ncbi:Dabb family protein [Aspergillus aculeatinus CBS 121060]|uniref:Dabb-domain-containing protein n=1 Tax=Aspergillus aculeatinus CBS 121060 TaxID=1448322 RepID=A0ACD1HND8_9EURO|nr:dabb-domain-containing protein [Aspergillus aculeatinus CBS 121060]RAH74944.1 dabb-domain-containing protein [Aspergillus aculeatinus CBS 121060]
MAILHLVLFRFKPEVSRGRRQAVLQEFMALSQKCKDESERPYIKSIRGGVECTAEVSSDHSHVFIVEFDSLQDREFYKNVDPIHAEFASRIIPLVSLTKMAVFEESDFVGI